MTSRLSHTALPPLLLRLTWAAVAAELLALATSVSATCPPDPTSPMITAPVAGKSGVEAVMTEEIWAEFYKGTSMPEAGSCTGTTSFFTLHALIEAAKKFPEFANAGDFDIDRRELAAFLANTAHETSGGWATAPCGNYAWGLCYKEEMGCEGGTCVGYCQGDGSNCVRDPNMGFPCPCTPGKTYHGRGPMQLSYNYNYAFFSKDFFGDENVLLQEPEKVSNDAVVAWEAALWFWHKPQSPKPSCHDVMTGRFTTTAEQQAGGWKLGFGMVTNIINGGVECGCTSGSEKPAVRVGYYERFTKLLGVHMCGDPSHTLWCNGMNTFDSFPASCPAGSTPPSSAECGAASPSGSPPPPGPDTTTTTPKPGASPLPAGSSSGGSNAKPPSGTDAHPEDGTSKPTVESAAAPHPRAAAALPFLLAATAAAIPAAVALI